MGPDPDKGHITDDFLKRWKKIDSGGYYSKQELEAMSIGELRKLAKENGISTAGAYSKQSLVFTVLSKRPKKKDSSGPDFLERFSKASPKVDKYLDSHKPSVHSKASQDDLDKELTKMESFTIQLFLSVITQ